jgi:hypothetical protein
MNAKPLVLGCGVVMSIFLVTLCAICLVIYWASKDFMKRIDSGRAEGREFGKTTDQKGCMDEGLRRAIGIKKTETGPLVNLRAFVSGCLESSRPSPEFCAGVPKWWEFITDWEVTQCQRDGQDPASTPGCIMVLEEKADFCGG